MKHFCAIVLQPLPQARLAGLHLRGQAGGRRPGEAGNQSDCDELC